MARCDYVGISSFIVGFVPFFRRVDTPMCASKKLAEQGGKKIEPLLGIARRARGSLWNEEDTGPRHR